jgi:uncharacterized membrane protein YcjF (UPF0283 family)
MKKYILAAVAFLFSLAAFAQGETGEQNLFKSNLKIYVVVAVLTIILICIFIFLFALERRLKKLEDNH